MGSYLGKSMLARRGDHRSRVPIVAGCGPEAGEWVAKLELLAKLVVALNIGAHPVG